VFCGDEHASESLWGAKVAHHPNQDILWEVYPGLPHYVDAYVANGIMALSESEGRTALTRVLDEPALETFLDRLFKLQIILADNRKHTLVPSPNAPRWIPEYLIDDALSTGYLATWFAWERLG